MATAHLVSPEEYLGSAYEYDAEYVEGKVVPRPMPQKPHSNMQGFLVWSFYQIARPLGYKVWDQQRLRTQADPARYRIPDVCITLGEPDEDIFTEPPFLCVEILSQDDSVLDLRTKIDEYLAFGVSYVWVVDPVALGGEIYTVAGIERARDGQFRAGDIEVDIRQAS